MSVVAIYNMKGGVGKTTTAVNLSYLAATAGQRVLLWDLDPQAASSFALRVGPHVERFSKKWVESGEVLAAAIKETDYDNLDLLPADFTYRKIDRLLGHLGKPERIVARLLDTLRHDYDLVILDCPPGFSLLIEGIFAAADAMLVPAIPTVLSLRTVARLVEWTIRSDSRLELAAFFSMVDRRKTVHRRVSESFTGQSGIFLSGHVPYSSVVEQMSVRRMPLAVYAPRDAATAAFAGIWAELLGRLQKRAKESDRPRDSRHLVASIESLIARLESSEGEDSVPSRHDVHFVHSFDTEGRDLQQRGYALELRERTDRLVLVVVASPADEEAEAAALAEVRVDTSWATEILSGAMSPLEALERRLGLPPPAIVENVRNATHGQKLRRINSHAEADVRPDPTGRDDEPCPPCDL